MPPNQDEPIVYEKTKIPLVVKIAAGLVVVSVFIVSIGLIVMKSKVNQIMEGQTSIEVPPVGPNVGLVGYLYYSGDLPGQGYQPGIYRHSFSSEFPSGFIADSAHSYAALKTDFDVMVMYQEGTTDPDNYQPVWRSRKNGEVGILQNENGYKETDLAVSPDEKRYAYSFQVEENGDEFAITDWSIAIHNYETGARIVLPDAIEPTWTYGGKGLVYLKSDGIYFYDVETSTSIKMIERYQNLSSSEDLASTADGRYLVLTLPSLNQVAVFEEQVVETGLVAEYVELTGLSDPGAKYRHPVLSPDGKLYAVVRVNESEYNEVTNSYTSAEVQVRATDTSQLIETVSLLEVDPNTLRLEAWRW